MNEQIEKIRADLFSVSDEKYRQFSGSLMPTVPYETVIGVRIPRLREYAQGLDAVSTELFLKALPHSYYEENNLHAFLIEKIKNYDVCIKELNRFLPFVDNWATCDSMRPKVFVKNKDRLIFDIKKWLESEHTYAVRFGIEMLMTHYLDMDFKSEYLRLVAKVKSEEYYIMMMQAWYFATALAKQYHSAIIYLENRKLNPWVHNKTISKACDSYRIVPSKKEYLKTLRY